MLTLQGGSDMPSGPFSYGSKIMGRQTSYPMQGKVLFHYAEENICMTG
jgi:hypothetical protein